MIELATALLVWIGANSSYDTANIYPPDIIEMTPLEITAESYTDSLEMIPMGRIDDRFIALYNFEKGENGTIYVLGAKWTDDGTAPEQEPWTDPIFQERVLHELVHHVQRVSGAYKTFPCRSYGEREAYELGGKFLKQNYATDPLPNRIFWSRVYSQC